MLKLPKNHASKFVGQNNYLEIVHSYMNDSSKNQRPLVLHGDSGCGKSALMSMIAVSCKKWISSTAVVLMRCLGQTPSSTTIRDLLISICEQLTVIYNIDPPTIDIVHSAVKMAHQFNHMLEQISKWHSDKQPLVLILDGVECLSDIDRALTMFWLPKLCPTGVYLILSTNSEHHILHRLKVVLLLITVFRLYSYPSLTFIYIYIYIYIIRSNWIVTKAFWMLTSLTKILLH